MKKEDFLYKNIKNTQINFTNNSLILSENNFKNFFFFFKKFFILIKNSYKSKNFLVDLIIHYNFLNYKDYYYFFRRSKWASNLMINLVLEEKLRNFYFHLFLYFFCQINSDKYISLDNIRDKFLIFRGLEEYNEYWNTSINRNNKEAIIAKKKKKL